jgi:hypothetical protein
MPSSLSLPRRFLRMLTAADICGEEQLIDRATEVVLLPAASTTSEIVP